jgi:hypothetical protein
VSGQGLVDDHHERETLPRPGAGLAARRLAYRQPSAGATWVRMLSMTWAL